MLELFSDCGLIFFSRRLHTMASNSPEEPSDIWYTSATKCGDIKGYNPTISIASDESAVMVYAERPVRERLRSVFTQLRRRESDGGEASSMFYTVGTLTRGKMTWGSQKAFESVACSFPSVAVANDGTVVLAYVKNSKCFYRIGMKERTKDSIEWYDENVIDEGSCPSVCISNDRTVVVAFISCHRHCYTRVGTVNLSTHTIVWTKDKQQLTGKRACGLKSVSVAVNDNKNVVIAYNTEGDTDSSAKVIQCKTGKITSGQIDFGKQTEAITGHSPTVSINMDGHIMLMFQEDLVFNVIFQRRMRNLFAQCGFLQDGNVIKWRKGLPDGIDFGHWPSVCLTEKGEFVEVHQSHVPKLNDSLYFRVGQLK